MSRQPNLFSPIVISLIAMAGCAGPVDVTDAGVTTGPELPDNLVQVEDNPEILSAFEMLSDEKQVAVADLIADHLDALMAIDPANSNRQADLETAQADLESRLASVLDASEFNAVRGTLAHHQSDWASLSTPVERVGPRATDNHAELAFVPGRIIVGFHDQVEEGLTLKQGGKAKRMRTLGRTKAGLFTLPANADVMETVEALRASGQYDYVEPDYIGSTSATVNDPYRSSWQWNFDRVNAEDAWDLSTGSDIIVAVIDSGLDEGDDGIGSVTDGYDFVNDDETPYDDLGHGTHVAGTIAQTTNNGVGVAGLAHDATIMPLKVCDSTNRCFTSDTIDAIEHAVDNGAHVINMSMGNFPYSSAMEDAVADAYDSGVFVAASAANDAATTIDYPGAYAGVVAVGATDESDALAWFSNTGPELDLVAPGVDIVQESNFYFTSWYDGSDEMFDWIHDHGFEYHYVSTDGTSMAAPHVSAAAAMLMSLGASNVEAEQYLKATADDLGSSGWDSTFGEGLIQPDAALDAFIDDEDRREDCDMAAGGARYGYIYTYYAEYYSNIAYSRTGDRNAYYSEMYLDLAKQYGSDAKQATHNASEISAETYGWEGYTHTGTAAFYSDWGSTFAERSYDATGERYSNLAAVFAELGADYFNAARPYAYSCYRG